LASKKGISLDSYYDTSESSSDEYYRVLPGINEAIGQKTVKNTDGYLPTGTAEQVVDMNEKYLNFRQQVQEDYLTTGYNYIFMTKPKLNLDPDTYLADDSGTTARSDSTEYNTNENGFFKYIASTYPTVMKNLSYLYRDNNSETESVSDSGNFIRLISNKVQNFSGVGDLVFDNTTVVETYKGYKVVLPSTYANSITGGTLSIDFTESDPPLLLYMHKVWMDYIEKIKFGILDPTDVTIKNKEIDYASSIYYIVTGPDGETIKFWAKFWNVIPKSLPLTSLCTSQGEHNIVQLSFQYDYSYVEYLDPATLSEFNDVMLGQNLDYDNTTDFNFYAFWGLLNIGSRESGLLNIGGEGGVSSVLPTAVGINGINYAVKTIRNYIDTINNTKDNSTGVPYWTTLTKSGIGMDTGAHDKAGIVKLGKDYKLVFYDD
jgi:hypothetical protein